MILQVDALRFWFPNGAMEDDAPRRGALAVRDPPPQSKGGGPAIRPCHAPGGATRDRSPSAPPPATHVSWENLGGSGPAGQLDRRKKQQSNASCINRSIKGHL